MVYPAHVCICGPKPLVFSAMMFVPRFTHCEIINVIVMLLEIKQVIKVIIVEESHQEQVYCLLLVFQRHAKCNTTHLHLKEKRDKARGLKTYRYVSEKNKHKT